MATLASVTKPEVWVNPLVKFRRSNWAQIANALSLLPLLRWVSFLELKSCWGEPGLSASLGA